MKTITTLLKTTAFCGLATAAFTTNNAQAGKPTDVANVIIVGKEVGHGLSIREKSKQRLRPSEQLHYELTGKVFGKGVAKPLAPQAVQISDLLESLAPGSSRFLKGKVNNPSGQYPATLVNKTFEGGKRLPGLGRVSFEARVVAKVLATGQVSVVIDKLSLKTPAGPVNGTLRFTGTKFRVETSPEVGFGVTKGVREDAGVVKVKVNRPFGKSRPATVRFETRDLTAEAGVDYSATAGELTFAAGEVTKTIDIPIIDNTTRDGLRYFNVVLTSASEGTTLGQRTTAKIGIGDND